MTKKTTPSATVKVLKPVTILNSTKEIETAIASIKNRGAKLDESIQQAGVSVILHLDKSGDTTLADRLFNAMPNGARRLALVEWLVTYGKMRVLKSNNKEDAKAIKAGRVFQYMHERVTDQAGAESKMWYEFRKESAPQEVFDVQSAFLSLMNRIKHAQSKGLTITNPELIEALQKVQA